MSDFKEINQNWKLADRLTVQQAAALIAGVEPGAVRFSNFDDGAPVFFEHEGYTETDGIGDCRTAFEALKNAINDGRLKATIRRDARLGGWDEYPKPGEAEREDWDGDKVFFCTSPNWKKTTVDRSDLVTWLESRGHNTGFFFPAAVASDDPDYLNPKHPRYAPKLAAAVRAWQAVTDTGGLRPKQALEKWLREHAQQLDSMTPKGKPSLMTAKGKPNETGIEEIAKVANWETTGGAPTTPGDR